MSIYSGFATRFQEQSYDHCIDSLLYILQKRIIKFYQNDDADEQSFINLVLKLYNQMKTMQKSKYLQPKSSQSINQLIKCMQVFKDNFQPKQKAYQPKQQISKPMSIILPQVNKKKSIYWVQKKPQPETQSNKASQEQDTKTINKNNYDVVLKDGKVQFRKTSYNPAQLKGIKLNRQQKHHLNKQQVQQRHFGNTKYKKNRSISNHPQDKPPGQQKITHYAHSFREENQNIPHKKKHRSVQKINQPEYQTLHTHQNEVIADIIKEYIIKAKKNNFRESKYKNKDVS